MPPSCPCCKTYGPKKPTTDPEKLKQEIIIAMQEKYGVIEREAAVAYIQDRALQYLPDSGIVTALCEVAASIKNGEHTEAHRHGELDDLIKKEDEKPQTLEERYVRTPEEHILYGLEQMKARIELLDAELKSRDTEDEKCDVAMQCEKCDGWHTRTEPQVTTDE